MDPLSLTAGIIAVIGAGGEVAKAIKKLASLKGAPNIVLALNNEISDLLLLVLAIRDVFERQKASTVLSLNDAPADTAITSTLKQANDKVLELNVLHQRLTALMIGPTGFTVRHKASWLREQNNVKKMQEDFRTVRLKLSTALGILNSSCLLRLETGMQNLNTKLGDVQTHQEQSDIVRDQNSVSSERALKESVTKLHSIQRRIELRLNADTALAASQAIESRASVSKHVIGSYEDKLDTAIYIDAFSHSHQCDNSCVCRCHQLQTRRSPRVFDRFLGCLFFGYTGLPNLAPPCDSQACNKSTCPKISFAYFFPPWLLQQTISVVAKLSLGNNPEISIRFPQIVSSTSRIFYLARHGLVHDIYVLFRQGLASPFDINHLSGATPLMFAASYGQVEACRMLLQAGADPYHEAFNSANTYDYLWRILLSNSNNPEVQERLRSLLPDQSYIERMHLTLLHKTVVGLNQLDLTTLIDSLPQSAIDETDSAGRTSLYWAARRGDTAKVSLLIDRGADIDKSTLTGESIPFAAIRSRNQACIQKVLNLFGDLNIRNGQGWTPLHFSCFFSGISTDTIDWMIRRGADINAKVLKDGATPLILAAQEDYSPIGELLIARGANLHAVTDNGEAALCRAVSYNSHRMIHLLFHHHSDHCVKTPLGETLLHSAGQYGDLKCLEALRANDLSGIDVEAQAKGLTALQMGERRRDVPPEWLPTFRALVDSVSNQSNATDSSRGV